jgi:hypothetical protein
MTPLATIFLLTGLSTFVASWFGPRIKLGAILTMMFAVAVFGARICDYPLGMISNVTNAPYAAVIVLIAIMGFRHGWRFVSMVIAPIFWWLAMWFLIVQTILAVPSPGETTPSIPLFVAPMHIAFWSLIAFACAVSVLLAGIRLLAGRTAGAAEWAALLALCVLAQAVDSAVFFSGAFRANPEMLDIMFGGFAWKAALTLPLSLALFARAAKPYDPEFPDSPIPTPSVMR